MQKWICKICGQEFFIDQDASESFFKLRKIAEHILEHALEHAKNNAQTLLEHFPISLN